MDFSFSEEQNAIVDAAQRVFADLCSDDTIKELSEAPDAWHAELWQQLAESGMLGLVVDEDHGGLGMSLTELCLILELQGRYVAPVPMIPTLVECGMTIGSCDNAALKSDLLPGIVGGENLLSPVRPSAGVLEPDSLTITAGDEYVIDGASGVVPYASIANGFIVTAPDTNGEIVIVYCPADAGGVSVRAQRMTSGELAGRVEFDNARLPAANVLAIGDAAREIAEQQKQNTLVALAALQVGTLSEGLKRTAEYVSQRKQFGRPLGAFQAVSQQAADAYMSIESLRSVYWRALDDLENGGDTALSSRVAKFWAGEAGHKVSHAVLHLHGGIGQDIDYPVHRFFLWGKHNERYIDTPDTMALEVGGLIAANADAVINLNTST